MFLEKWFLIVALCLFLAGCSAPNFSQKDYYLLEADLLDVEPINLQLSKPLVLNSVELAGYLNVRSLVERKAGQLIRYSNDHYWAYDLDQLISDFSYDYLGRYFHRFFGYQKYLKKADRNAYFLNIFIHRLDGGIGQKMKLRASVYLKKDNAILAHQEIQKVFSAPIHSYLDLFQGHTKAMIFLLNGVKDFLVKNHAAVIQ